MLLLGSGLRDLRFDFSLEPILVASTAELRAVEEFQARVPPRFFDVVFALTWPRPIRADDLDRVAEIAEDLAEDPSVASVRSLATAPVVRGAATWPIPVPFPEAVAPGRSVAEEVAAHPVLHGVMLSRDGASTPLFVRFRLDSEQTPPPEWIERAWRRVVESAGPEIEVRRIGGPLVEHAMSRSMGRDVARNLALQVIFCTLLLVLLFRSVRGAAVPMAVVLLSLAASIGSLSRLGFAINLIDMAIPGLVTIIGLCDAVHMLHRFEDAYARTGDRRASILDMMSRVGAACLHTSLTTCLGFLSLLVSRHEAVRWFGIKASLAVAVTFAVVIAGVPLILAASRIGEPRPVKMRLPGFVVRPRRRVVLWMAALVALLSSAGALRVKADSYWLEELPPDAPEVRDLRWFETSFAGLLSVDVRLDGDLADPDVFFALSALERRIEGLAGVDGAHSYTAWIREVLGNPASMTAEDVRRGVRLMRLSGPHFPGYLVDPEFRHGRLSFRTGDVGTRRFLELEREIERAARDLPPQVRAEVAGYMKMAHESSRLVVTTMMRSFLVSLLTISAFIALIYRSWKVGLISVVPNVLPVAAALGLNGWLDIPLRIGIVMIYGLGLGLAVDDTIRLVTRFLQERRDRPDRAPRAAVRRAVASTGRALVVTSLILSVGCLCYLPSEFRSMTDVGTLLNAVVIAALLADLFLLPILLEWIATRGGRGSRLRP